MLPPPTTDVLSDLNIKIPSCRSILIVDDEQDNLDVLEAWLEDDWDVQTAINSDQALAVINSGDPVDLIIADQRMPGMTGVELLTLVAKESPDTVRMMLTAYSDLEPMLAAVNKGSVYRFMLKPFDPVEIRAIVEDALHIKAISTALRLMVAALSERREELDRTLQKLKQAQDQLVVAERKATLGSVTSGIVHELNNLTTNLSFLMGSVREATDNPVLLESAERTWANLDSLRELLEQIRAFARSDSIDVKRKQIPAASFFSATTALFSMEALGTRCPVRIQVSEALQKLFLDQSRIRQAVIALLRNAAQANVEGVPIVLSVQEAEDVPGGICIEISDLGCGMGPKTLAKSAEPFYSAFEPRGMGLGLEIASLTAVAHGGRLLLESTLGEGTCARLILAGATEGAASKSTEEDQ